jgi:hypothetical protein
MQSAEKREACYAARDTFYQCVADKGIDACAATVRAYEDACPGSWRGFFDKQRERQMVLEGQSEMMQARAGARRDD